jgi:ferredoxin
MLYSDDPYAGVRRAVSESGRWHVKVTVDSDLCEANAVCAGLVPELFAVDDDDNLHILMSEVPAGLAQAVRHAVRSCPKAALKLDE